MATTATTATLHLTTEAELLEMREDVAGEEAAAPPTDPATEEREAEAMAAWHLRFNAYGRG